MLIDLKNVTNPIVSSFSVGTADLDQVDTIDDNVINMTSSLRGQTREPDAVAWLDAEHFVTADEGDLCRYDCGSRSITIWNTSGSVIYSSGNLLEHAAVRVGQYPEERSDYRGAEPHFVAVCKYRYTTYLIVLLERANLVAVFDAMDVAAPRLTQLLPAGNLPESAACHDDFFVVANQLDDGDRSQDRSALTIYRYEEAEPTFPWLESVDDDQGVPIPFASLSSLAAGAGTTLYSAEDGSFDKNRIFTIDVATQPAQLTEAVRIVDTNGVFRTALSYSYDYDYQLDVDDFINGDDTVNIDPEGLAYDGANNRFVVASEGSGNYYNEDIDRLNWLFQVSLGGVIEKVISLPESVNAIQKSRGFEGVAIDHASGNYVVSFQRAWGEEAHPRIGIYNTTTETWTFFWYPLDSPRSRYEGGYVCLADIAPTSQPGIFLVSENDNRGGPDVNFRVNRALTRRHDRFPRRRRSSAFMPLTRPASRLEPAPPSSSSTRFSSSTSCQRWRPSPA